METAIPMTASADAMQQAALIEEIQKISGEAQRLRSEEERLLRLVTWQCEQTMLVGRSFAQQIQDMQRRVSSDIQERQAQIDAFRSELHHSSQANTVLEAAYGASQARITELLDELGAVAGDIAGAGTPPVLLDTPGKIKAGTLLFGAEWAAAHLQLEPVAVLNDKR